jgi:hypothetical protein
MYGMVGGIFSYQKSYFGYTMEGFKMENFGIFYGDLEYSMAIW